MKTLPLLLIAIGTAIALPAVAQTPERVVGGAAVGNPLATSVAAIDPAAPPPPAVWGQPQWLPAPYPGAYQQYPFAAPTPRDAYRDGLINRWEFEQYEGPMPQALQGPSPDGTRGGDSGGDFN